MKAFIRLNKKTRKIKEITLNKYKILNTNILYSIFYLIFSLFPQLIAVDDVLPQYIRPRPHGGQRIQISIGHPDGKYRIFLPQRLSATDTVIVVPADSLPQIELDTAGYQTC